MRRAEAIFLLLSLLVPILGACESGGPAGGKPRSEIFWSDMVDQPRLAPQSQDIIGGRPIGDRLPPEGAIATDQYPYPYTREEADLAANLKNPLKGDKKTLKKGKKIYESYCIVCHGPKGAGDGEVGRLFPKPPSLMRQKVRDYSDGRIFHTPKLGQNAMPSLSNQIGTDELWGAVHYIRKLQADEAVAPPTKKDLDEIEAGKNTAEKANEKPDIIEDAIDLRE